MNNEENKPDVKPIDLLANYAVSFIFVIIATLLASAVLGWLMPKPQPPSRAEVKAWMKSYKK